MLMSLMDEYGATIEAVGNSTRRRECCAVLEAPVANLMDAARIMALHGAIAVLIYPGLPVLVGCKRLLKLQSMPSYSSFR